MKKRNMISILFILCVFINSQVFSQSNKKFSVKGRVVDAKTDEPLFYADVFLANTSIGTATDKNGEFLLEQVPQGRYELIVSHIGYKLIKTEINLTPEEKIKVVNFKLVQELINAPEIEVVAKRDPDWDNKLKIFTQYFLGSSKSGEQCVINNPEVLDFQKGKDVYLTAKADEPLIIINKYLGYKIRYILDDFYINKEGQVGFTGSAFFKEIKSKNRADSLMIARRREQTYKGSLAHFLRSVINKNVEEQGFEVDTLTASPFKEKYVDYYKVDLDTIAQCVININEVELYLPKWIIVTYKYEYEESEIKKILKDWKGINKNKDYQVSVLFVENSPVICSEQGYLFIPQSIRRYGHLAYDRMGEMLPIDYLPVEYQ